MTTQGSQAMLQTGAPAPVFSAFNQDGQLVSLHQYQGTHNVVLYFYPRDDTPGCTVEANQFSELIESFKAMSTVVLGVSRDSAESHRAFIDKYGLEIELLSDTSGGICERYDVWREKEKDGERKMGILRSTFIIDRQGLLRAAMYGVSPQGHAQSVLDEVRKL